MKATNFDRYKSVLEDLGYGSVVGEKIPETITYGEAAKELKYYIDMANEKGEPFNIEVFGDEYEEPIQSVRKAYFRAKRLLKKFLTMDKNHTLTLN